MVRAVFAFALAAILSQAVYFAAAADAHFVTVVFNVRNAEDGTAVPATLISLDPAFAGPPGRGVFVETNAEGEATATFLTFPGPWTYIIGGGQFFKGHTGMIEINGPGRYFVDIRLQPKAQRPSLHSNKYIDQTDRTLHIRVQGRLANGTLVPVHYAMIYDRHDRHIITTDYEGHATAYVREVMGETVTLKAEGSHWRPATSSFIVGAAEHGTRTTRNDDYVNFVLNGEDAGESEEHSVDIRVWGLKNGKRTAVHYASIYDAEGHHLATTDYYGRATARVKAPLGESYVLKAEATHWKSATKDVQSGSAGGVSATFLHESVEFVLNPEGEGKQVVVEVLDHATDKPISGAEVKLYKPDHFPGTEIASSSTNAQGNASFDAGDLENAVLNGEARVGATHGGYAPEVQSVAAGSEHYVIYLKKKESASGWSGEWSGGGLASLRITASGNTLSYTYRGDDVNAYRLNLVGQGQCTVNGRFATCRWTQQSHDSDYVMTETGRERWELVDNIIHSDWTLETTTCTPPCPGRTQYNGATGTPIYRRKK